MKKKFSEFFLKFRLPIISALFFLTIATLDMFSSVYAMSVPGVHESNPFTRDTNYRFLISHHIVYNLLWFVGLSGFAFSLYQALKDTSDDLAKIVSSLPFFLNTINGVGAIVNNIMHGLRWYVE